jgi:hypothetical protein
MGSQPHLGTIKTAVIFPGDNRIAGRGAFKPARRQTDANQRMRRVRIFRDDVAISACGSAVVSLMEGLSEIGSHAPASTPEHLALIHEV